VFFSLFGVSVFTARVLVALAVALCAILLYRLVLKTHGSAVLAAAVTSTFCFWHYAQTLAGDVMLEFPSMIFVLGAMLTLSDRDSLLSWRRSLGFALLAAAAVWTKQQTVFLGLVPFLYILFARRWRLLRSYPLWAGSAVFGLLVFALMRLSAPFHGVGVNQVTTRMDWLQDIFTHNLWFYCKVLPDTVGLIPCILIVGGFATLPFLRFERNSSTPLYAAWAAASFAILLILGPYDRRYLFFTYPPLLVMGYDALSRLTNLALPKERAWVVPAAVAAACAFLGLLEPVAYLSGPAQSASAIVTGAPRRILYCGSTDGNFIFAVRALDPRLQTVVVAGEKLMSTHTPEGFENFARRYGIEYVVIEQTARTQPCDALRNAPAPSMVFEREVPLTSSLPRWNGALRIFRFAQPSARPDDKLTIAVPKIGQTLQVKF
jgi:hypothetical protein